MRKAGESADRAVWRFFVIALLWMVAGCSDDDGGPTGGEGCFGPTVLGRVTAPSGPIEGALITGLAWSNNRCGGPGGVFGVFNSDSVRTNPDGTYEFDFVSCGGGLPGTSVDFLCIQMVAEPPVGLGFVPDTVVIMDYEVLLFVAQEIEVNFVLREPGS